MSDETTSDAGGTQPAQLTFHYLKSSQFRVVHMDGALGSLTPRGLIHCCVYSERPSIPLAQTFNVGSDGQLTGDPETATRGGLVRELEVDLMLSLEAASELRDWLTRMLKDAETKCKELEGSES